MTYLIVATLVGLAVAAALYFLVDAGLIATTVFAGVCLLILNPVAYSIGMNIARTDATTFNEYWSGWEKTAELREVECTRDGPCVHEYQCDPYSVPVTKTRSVPDGRGGVTTEVYIEIETHYHACPYSTQETSYYVTDTMGSTHTVAGNLMTGTPWRSGKPIPGGQVTAIPARWLEVKERLEAGEPGPVTSVHQYTNYILASQQTLFRKYEGNIETLLTESLLPTPVRGVVDLYHAQKLYNVGGVLTPAQMTRLTKDVAYLNGAVGGDLHGDVHVVMVPKDIMMGPDTYSQSLMAYWQSKSLGRDAISKNAIIVILGVDKSKNAVDWARAFTGMPVGNEAMLQQIQSDMRGARLDKDLIGRPTFDHATEQIKHTNGALESILWGPNEFSRVSMSGDGNEGAGFGYLVNDIEVSTSAYVTIGVVNFFLMVLVGVGVVAVTNRFAYH